MKYIKDIAFQPNSLVYGDCLNILQQWADDGNKVDLIYLDPPFNSNVNYHVIYKKENPATGQIKAPQHRAFDDMWDWHAGESDARIERLLGMSINRQIGKTCDGLRMILGECGMLAYVTYMAERLIYMHRILKDTGSIYLHCDPTASYYLRVVLDAIFVPGNFRNEVVWSYKTGGVSKRWFARKHDTILVYAKNLDKSHFNLLKEKSYLTHKYGFKNIEIKEDEGGLYRDVTMRDVWDIPALRGNHPEYLNYPTQKPLKLLRRIIAASSNPGDIVLDPFCGCGTAAHASFDMLGDDGKASEKVEIARQFIGIDISPYAINQVCKQRLKNVSGLTVHGIPGDIKSLRAMYDKDHSKWTDIEKIVVTSLRGFAPNDRQTGDGGVDGWGKLFNQNPLTLNGQKLPRDCIAQVKMGKPSVDSIRAFAGKLYAGDYALGIFVTLEKYDMTKTMREEISKAGKLKFKDGAEIYDRLIFWSMQEIYADLQPQVPQFTDPYTGKPMQDRLAAD